MFAQMQKCVRGSLARMAFEKVRFPGMLRAQHSFVWMHRYYTGRYVQKLLQSYSGTHGALSVALRSAESYVLRSWLRHLRCCNWLHVTGTSVDRNLPLRPKFSTMGNMIKRAVLSSIQPPVLPLQLPLPLQSALPMRLTQLLQMTLSQQSILRTALLRQSTLPQQSARQVTGYGEADDESGQFDCTSGNFQGIFL